ncbi:amidohydrolase family protein [Rhodococcus erythropolis]|uniref:amidohydrolase family protein n=1 Tax=Rhodococcus erythropolis TaxID=1833 RepID=UPI002948EB4C|nr:amidohydrolase family protein [Rhodococcus erythropolis]MDV6277534.1 amidohydrolase family protein [Rhodococcus erythropolis]
MKATTGIRARRLFDGHRWREGPALILIENGIIGDIDFSGARCPEGIEYIDLGESAVLPGLVDAHAHLTWAPQGDPQNLATDTDEILLGRARRHADQALRSGVTTIRDLGDRGYATVSLQQEYRHGAVGPQLLTSGPPLTRTGGHCWYLGGEADTSPALTAAVDEHARRGVDWIKIMATGGFRTQGTNPWSAQYTREQLTAVVDTAHGWGLPVTAHAHATAGIAAAVAAGVDGLEHCTFVGEDGAVLEPRIVESIVQQDIWCGITIARPRDGLPVQTLSILEKKWGNVRALMAAGARIAFSTDAGINSAKPHDTLPRDLVYLTSQGFSPLEVLTAATADAAASCGIGTRKGRIAPGYDADLLAVPGTCKYSLEPLLEITEIFRAGRAVTRLH